MTEIVRVPKWFNYQTMHAFTGAVVGPDGVPTDNDFLFSFDDLTFIDGSGLTVFANTLEWLISHGAMYSFAGHVRPDSDPIAYLDDCGFFERYADGKVRKSASARRTTLPIVMVAHAEAFGWLEHKFTPWMAGVLGVGESALGSVKVCIKEVFNNIQDHSDQHCGFVHVQHYPNINRVAVTMSDFGRGIPANIRASFPDDDDGAAILRATAAGFTTKSTVRNMGVGLDFLIESVTGNEGDVSIYSGKGAVRCHRDSAGVVHRRPSLGSASYPGTLVEMSLQTDRFVGDASEEGDLTW